MNALNFEHFQVPRASSAPKIQPAIAKTVVEQCTPKSRFILQGSRVRWGEGGRRVDRQFLILEKSSWASNNLNQTLLSRSRPSDDELRAAKEAVERIKGRAGEDVNAWAVTLAKKYSVSRD